MDAAGRSLFVAGVPLHTRSRRCLRRLHDPARSDNADAYQAIIVEEPLDDQAPEDAVAA